MVRVVLKHLSGSRMAEVDIVPLGPHSELILGAAESAAIRFDPASEQAVARWHARIIPLPGSPGQFVLEDLSHTQTTLLNSARVETAMPLRPGDVLQLGVGGPRLQFQVELL